MKKNKLTFLIAASFLALSTIAGCTTDPTSKGSSKEADNSALLSSDVGGDSNGQTSQGGDNTSQGGGTTTKTDWTDTEKATMRNALHGLVLPFVEMDVSVQSYEGSIIMMSTDNMQEGFLSNYAAKFKAGDGWEGGDVSDEVGQYANSGLAYGFVKEVTQNNSRYYVSVMFAGVVDPQASRTTYSKTGKFILQTGEPYVAEYPTTFVAQWLQAQFNTTINPPAFQAEYYCLADEGIMYGYTETNIEESYKTALTSSNNFTIDANKDAQGYYVAHPTDGSYELRFQYMAADKIFVIMVTAPKGWNNSAINAIFTKNHVTPFSLGSIENPSITFSATEQSVAEATYMFISINGVSVQDVQAYINSLKALGYKVADSNVVVESNQYFTTVNVITNEGMFTIYVTYSTAENANNLMIYFNLAPNQYVVKDWPAASVARYLQAEHDTVPAFAGNAYGFNFSVMNTYNNVVVILDNGAESTAKDAYISTLTVDNGYTAHGTLGGQPAFLSPNSEILVAVGCDPTNFPGEIDILIQNYTVVETPWPADEVAAGIEALAFVENVTDTIPALSVGSASECYVNSNFGGEKFEINIDGLADRLNEFIGDFKTAGWTEDPYYGFDTPAGAYGALISPNKQLVAYFDTVSNDVIIAVKGYYEQSSYTWPSQDINQILNKWGVKFDTLPSFDRAAYIETQENSSEQKLNILVYVGSGLEQRVITDYCVALEAIGYHYDETLGGHISGNHELLIKFNTDANGVKIIVSSIKIVYKVVGYNNDDWAFANGLIMTVTPEEGNYKIQYQASFHVEANAKFKVLDSENNWYGGLNNFAKYSNANNDIFSIQENGDIKVNAAGTVTVYFKIYDDNSKDMWLEFAADPVAASWPTDQINAALEGWGVTDEIPVLQDASISDIQFSGDEDSFTLSILGGGGLAGAYQATLLETYSEDPDTHKLISPSGKLSIDVHANADELVVVVNLIEQPELKPWPEEEILSFFGENKFVAIPEIKIEGASFEIVAKSKGDDGVELVSLTATVSDAENKMNAAIEALEHEFNYSYSDEVYVSSNEGFPVYRFGVRNDGVTIEIIIAYIPPVNEPVFKLVGSFSNWSYEDENSDELLKNDSPEEGYLAQYSINFEVKAGDEFKIYDGSGDSGWVGGEAFQANEWFEVLSGGNIKAKQDGMVDLAFDILSDGTKKITINDFEPEFEDGTWAKARYEALQGNPDVEIPNLEIEGVSEYVYNPGNNSIDISFIEGADLSNLPLSLSSQLEAAGFHYSARFDGFVKISTNTLLGIGFNNDGTLSIYPGTFDFANDSGYGVVIFAYDETEDYYYDDDEIIGIVNPENSNEYVVTYSFEEGTWFIIYDFGDETQFEVSVDPASGVTNDGSFADYFEYDMNTNMFRVKQDFEGTIYIKLIYGNDQIYVAITNPNP